MQHPTNPHNRARLHLRQAESSVDTRKIHLTAMQIFGRKDNSDFKSCPTCGNLLSETHALDEVVTHNVDTCRLVNLALSQLGVSLEQTIRVDIYPGAGPLRGFYFTADPYSIHVSEEAYSQLREYIIFHETKHLVDCLTIGRSEEITPDQFARSLCVKYGYRCPDENLATPWFAYA